MDNNKKKKINLWGYYKKQITWSDPLVTFSLDSIEFHENVRWTLEKLKNEKPAPGMSHDWNAATSALEMYMPEFTKAYKKFRKRMTEKNAQAFSDAFDEINSALQMAKNAMFNNMLREHWNEVQDELRAKE